MATDDEKKAQALEDLLKDSLHAMESVEEVKRLQQSGEDEAAPTASQRTQATDAPSTETDRKREQDDQPRSYRSRKAASDEAEDEPVDENTLLNRITGLTGSALRFALRTGDTSWKVGKALMKSQDQLKVMLAAGQSLKDLREVAGLTKAELSEALNLRDKSLIEAVENGTAALSFELILRLAALLARNDPLPFILRYTRTYNPEIWKLMHDWGVGRLPLQFEREREFVNIFRRHDAARRLSDEGFAKVLAFTRSAFEMSLHFVAEEEDALAAYKADLERQHKSDAKPAEDDSGDTRKKGGRSSNGRKG